MRTQKHHIIPKHMGGSNDPSNLYECTIEQHAELHLSLYLEHGKVEDWVAYHTLAGQMSCDEAKFIMMEEGARRGLANMTAESYRKGALTRTGMKRSEATKQRMRKPHGPKHTAESKAKLSAITSESNRGKRWYHDPLNNKTSFAFECPEGYLPGRGNFVPTNAYQPGHGKGRIGKPKKQTK